MIKRVLWVVFALLATGIGFYPVIYFIADRRFGLLSSKSSELLGSLAWNMSFYTHIVLGGVALLIGWMQFSSGLRNRNPGLHRVIGKLYVASVMFSAASGIYIAFFASGGIIPASGFIGLGAAWLISTWMAYTSVRKGDIERHRRLMVYSYAACFAAVTLRIWLPLLTIAFGDFITAYRIVAWLCWLPNMAVAWLIVRNTPRQPGYQPISKL